MASLSEVEAILITAFIASILAAWGVVTQRVITRRLTTINYLTEQERDNDIIAARRLFNSLSDLEGALTKYSQPSDLNKRETNAVRLVLNDYELRAIGVQEGLFDLDIIKRFNKGTIIRDWARAAPYVYKLRAELDNPHIYFEFENLAHWVQGYRRPKRRIWPKLWF